MLAELAYDKGDAATAAALAERYLRRFAPQDRLERAPGLELLARARIALDDEAGADAAVAELHTIAEEVGAPLLQGRARIELARAFQALARTAPARAEALAARRTLAGLGAARLVERGDALLAGLPETQEKPVSADRKSWPRPASRTSRQSTSRGTSSTCSTSRGNGRTRR